MLNRDYLKYISEADDDFKCLLAFEDADVLRTADISYNDFKEEIRPYVQSLNVEALYCLCIYIIHLFVHNEVFVTLSPDEDEFFEFLSKMRDKGINKISFSVVDGSPVSITNQKFIRFVEKEIDTYRELVEFSQYDVMKVQAKEYLNIGDIQDYVFVILSELIKHETNKQKLSVPYKNMVVKILNLFKLRVEIVHNLDNHYCEREVYDSIKSKIKPLKWFPQPNTKDNPYHTPQQIRTHDRFKGRKVPRKNTLRG